MRKPLHIALMVGCLLLICFTVSASETIQPGVLVERETKTIGGWDEDGKRFLVKTVILRAPDTPPVKGIRFLAGYSNYDIFYEEIEFLRNAMDCFVKLAEQKKVDLKIGYKEYSYQTKLGIEFDLVINEASSLEVVAGNICLIRLTQLSDIKALKGYIDDAYEYLVNYKE